MRLRNPVVLAGVVGVGTPVLAAGVVAALTIDPGGNSLDSGAATAASPAASAAPAPSATPAPAPPAKIVGTPDQVGFQPDSISFVSATEGWVLGRSYPCAAKPCLSLRHTVDGGELAAGPGRQAPLRTATTGAALTFADSRNGWIRADGKLFSTHDGGSSWRRVDLEINAVMDHWTLSVAEDSVFIAATQPGEQTVLFTSPVDSDSWSETTDIPVGVGGGPDPSAEVSVVGGRAWLFVTNRTRSGARLVGGAWTPWRLPCGGNGPADWHALSEKRVLALCGRPGPGTNDSDGTHLMTAIDGGVTFTETGTLTSGLAFSVLAPADPTHLVAAVDDKVFTSADGGETWTPTYTEPNHHGRARAGEFISATTGFVILDDTGPARNAATMLITRDTGRTWTAVAFDA